MKTSGFRTVKADDTTSSSRSTDEDSVTVTKHRVVQGYAHTAPVLSAPNAVANEIVPCAQAGLAPDYVAAARASMARCNSAINPVQILPVADHLEYHVKKLHGVDPGHFALQRFLSSKGCTLVGKGDVQRDGVTCEVKPHATAEALAPGQCVAGWGDGSFMADGVSPAHMWFADAVAEWEALVSNAAANAPSGCDKRGAAILAYYEVFDGSTEDQLWGFTDPLTAEPWSVLSRFRAHDQTTTPIGQKERVQLRPRHVKRTHEVNQHPLAMPGFFRGKNPLEILEEAAAEISAEEGRNVTMEELCFDIMLFTELTAQAENIITVASANKPAKAGLADELLKALIWKRPTVSARKPKNLIGKTGPAVNRPVFTFPPMFGDDAAKKFGVDLNAAIKPTHSGGELKPPTPNIAGPVPLLFGDKVKDPILQACRGLAEICSKTLNEQAKYTATEVGYADYMQSVLMSAKRGVAETIDELLAKGGRYTKKGRKVEPTDNADVRQLYALLDDLEDDDPFNIGDIGADILDDAEELEDIAKKIKLLSRQGKAATMRKLKHETPLHSVDIDGQTYTHERFGRLPISLARGAHEHAVSIVKWQNQNSGPTLAGLSGNPNSKVDSQISQQDAQFRRAMAEHCARPRFAAVPASQVTAVPGSISERVVLAREYNRFRADVVARLCHVVDANPFGCVVRGDEQSESGAWVALLHPSNLRSSQKCQEYRGFGFDVTLFIARKDGEKPPWGAIKLGTDSGKTTWVTPMVRWANHEANHVLRRPVLDRLVIDRLVKCNRAAPNVLSIARAEAIAEAAMCVKRDSQHVCGVLNIMVRGSAGASRAFEEALGIARRIGHRPEYGRAMLAAADMACMPPSAATSTVVRCIMSVVTASGPGYENHHHTEVRSCAEAMMSEIVDAAVQEDVRLPV